MQLLYKIIILPIEYLIEFIFMFSWKHFHSAGVAIIIVSLVINFLVLPIYRRADNIQEQERLKQSRMSKWVKHIRKHFTRDERFLLLSAYYREENYHPLYALRSILSLLLQIPFFIAAYHFLSSNSELNGVSFLVLSDLGKPDGLLCFSDISIHVLPFLMTFFNIISGILYMKGFPLKSKIQHYLLTLFFLIFLYNSPSGLVFYWTLNNLFSLLKNLFLKHLSHPRQTLNVILLLLGCTAFGFLMLPENRVNITEMVYAGIILLICALPLIISLTSSLRHRVFSKYSFQDKSFPLLPSQIFLTLLWGLWIPLSVISASPGEFVDQLDYHNPLHFAFDNLCICGGLFLLWGSVFIHFLPKKISNVCAVLLWCFSGIYAVNYLFFGRNLGYISPELTYDTMFNYSNKSIMINLLVLVVLFLVFLYISIRHPRIQLSVSYAAILATAGLSLHSIILTMSKMSDQAYLKASSEVQDFYIPISRTGKNVVIFTLDRAVNAYFPFILYERPDLIERYSGFTYYPNTISYGPHTAIGSKAMMGGYEYTPLRVMERSTDIMSPEIQDESLKVMPVLFANAGFDVRTCDPPYAGGQIISDVSIFDDCEGVKAYQLIGHYNTLMIGREARMTHHFFFYSIFKCAPLLFQKEIYNAGTYYYAEGKGTFTRQNFLDSYSILQHLVPFTKITGDSTNTFLVMNNDTTHDTAELQLPDYEPALIVDNTGLETGYRTNAEGKTIPITNNYYLYHGNMAAYLKIADWIDYLKEQGCYDNTRIIVVSDHATGAPGFPEFDIDDYSVLFNNPMLMVKDFNCSGDLAISYDFMTNADTPIIAMNGLIIHPVNPFTGNELTANDKSRPYQYIITNNGNYMVHDNIFDKENWSRVE